MRKVVELFAGVGGFRVGLNNVKFIKDKVVESNDFNFVFFNQWEPNIKNQFAYKCYSNRFNEGPSYFIRKNEKFNLFNMDINMLDKKIIPDHDLLVGGFPCQDYSVARSLKNEAGIEGKKGVLWWEIYKILEIKRPKFILLENVDRLLISPSKQRGRDFSIMLKCLEMLGYYVEWKIINASDYGMPQKRKRIFIFACRKDTIYYRKKLSNFIWDNNICDIFSKKESFFKKTFDFRISKVNFPKEFKFDIHEISKSFSTDFYDFGFLQNNHIYTFKTNPIYDGEIILLENIIENIKNVDDIFYINDSIKIEKIRYLKGSKKIIRKKGKFEYVYSEGKMEFPEPLNKPSRTMLTSEGTINRSSHFIKQENQIRYLTPLECERLNMFPDNWTKLDSITNRNRYFLMGNALVCGIISKISSNLKGIMDLETN